MEEGLLVVDASSCTPSLPLTMEQIFVPGLLEGEEFSVDLATEAHIGEPLHPIMKLHPKEEWFNKGEEWLLRCMGVVCVSILTRTPHHPPPSALTSPFLCEGDFSTPLT